MREVEWIKMEGLETIVEGCSHHQSGGGGVVSAAAGQVAALQPTFGDCECSEKICKNKVTQGQGS